MIAFCMSRRADVTRHSANVQGRKMKMLLIHEFLYFTSISLRNWIATYKEYTLWDTEKLEFKSSPKFVVFSYDLPFVYCNPLLLEYWSNTGGPVSFSHFALRFNDKALVKLHRCFHKGNEASTSCCTVRWETGVFVMLRKSNGVKSNDQGS